METLKFENSIEILYGKFPEFKESEQFKLMTISEDLPYVVYSWFYGFIIKNLRNDFVVKKFISFINESFNDPTVDPELLNLMQIEFFENLTSSKDLIEFARKNFIGKALEMFEFTSKHFGVEAAESCSK
jgi:hypothetical protein